MKIAIGIPTTGRADLLKKVIDVFDLQSRKADAIFICPASDVDIENIEFDSTNVIRVNSDKGASKQRNAILHQLQDFDLVVFFDDDFVAHEDYIKNIEYEFDNNADTVIATGNVIADGARNAGLSFEEALLEIDKFSVPDYSRQEIFGSYGCNMAIRLATIFEHDIFFDKNLPLYSWLEDLDLNTRISKYGKSVKISNACGVHMGHKAGRTSGLRYGYSQVANPLYIAKKGNGFTYFMAITMSMKNIMANLARSIFPEPYIDRTGRLKGNIIAIKDILNGRLDPKRIEEL